MLLKLYRTLMTGIQNFYRNGWLSLATISVIVVTLFIINLQVAVTTANKLFLEDVEDKVSIAVYFKPDVTESDVLKVRDDFYHIKEVEKIEYISREEAFDQFKKRNEENDTIRKSLEELGTNPLGATLNIKAKDPDQYEMIDKTVQASKYKEIISRVNYHQYRDVIDNLNKEVVSNQRVAIIIGLTLSLIAIMITFNSIRITMYSYRQEIEIMRLVGASNTYIRFPFIWEGIIYGLISSVLVLPLIYLYLQFVADGDSSGSVLPFSNSKYLQIYLSEYYLKHLFGIALLQICLGIALGVVSSMIAIRKYLKI